MKNTYALKNAARSIFIATAMFAVAGVVQAQSNATGPGGGSTSAKGESGQSPAGKKGTTAGPTKKLGGSNQGGDTYTYGKDQGRDYARSQGASASGQPMHTYGKDAGADYEWSSGARAPGTSGRGMAGFGSSGSQSDHD
jgi:hypothetical protein